MARPSPPSTLHRIGYGPDPWQLSPTPKFKERFDDPNKIYRVLYASSTPLGSYLECLAPFRRSVLPELNDLAATFGGAPDHVRSGVVPIDWIRQNVIGSAKLKVDGDFADIYSSEWISRLREPLRPLLISHGIADLDASVLKQPRNRLITQFASEFVRESGYSGISYRSRWGDDIQNWAIFEPYRLSEMRVRQIRTTSFHFRKALSLLELSLEETGVSKLKQ